YCPRNVDPRDSPDERTIDLDLVELEIAEVGQTRISGPEIVERNPEANGMEGFKDRVGVVGRFQQHAFGYFKHEAAGIHIILSNQRTQSCFEVDVTELHRRKVQ